MVGQCCEIKDSPALARVDEVSLAAFEAPEALDALDLDLWPECVGDVDDSSVSASRREPRRQ